MATVKTEGLFYPPDANSLAMCALGGLFSLGCMITTLLLALHNRKD